MLIKAMVVFLSMLLVGSCDNSTENKGDNEPDSTTQNFTFEEYEFGDGSSSSLFKDVWIFDENNIWVVGEVLDDPRFDKTYNIFQWNGSKWLGRGRLFNSGGIDGIWALDSSHIYFAVGGVIEYKNQTFTILETNLGLESNQGIEHLWGSSESNIWGVGPWGTIVHYDGSKWTKLDFDTGWYFRDITGNKTTGIGYAVCHDVNGSNRLYKLENGNAELVFEKPSWDFDSGWLYEIHQLNEKELLLINGYVYKYNLESGEVTKIIEFTEGEAIFEAAIAAENDIYYFGHTYEGESFLMHYNGKRYKRMSLPFRDGGHMNGSFAIKDLAVEVEYSLNKAYLIKVKRATN